MEPEIRQGTLRPGLASHKSWELMETSASGYRPFRNVSLGSSLSSTLCSDALVEGSGDQLPAGSFDGGLAGVEVARREDVVGRPET